MTVPRRKFLASLPMAVATAAALAHHGRTNDALRAFLEPHVLKRSSLDLFLDPKARVWARFDPELGYLLRNAFVRDGVDGCHTLARYQASGQRQQVNFADQPCRINTYGDSFTQGHQVSDGETWQEILAAHFCEPIRNFGVGGFGVYQAYRRLLRNEATNHSAKYLIFNIWGDDHLRSVYAWRWLSFPGNVLESMAGTMFHANPWVHARLSDAGDLIERDNMCPSEESLYQLCDLDFLVDSFAEDEIVHMLFAQQTGSVLDKNVLERAASSCNHQLASLTSAETTKKGAQQLLHAYAIRVGIIIMERLQDYCEQNDKELMVLLSYPIGSVWHACNRSSPDDPDNVDWHPDYFKRHLREIGIPVVDSLPAHVAEFDTFKLSAKQYVDRYYIGHYTPQGNHFFAYAIKDSIRHWLTPPPPAYQNDDSPLIRFQGYLPG
ncbi:SGNH/GDSL hydrolase family protein [Pirellulaceae bacterium SH449]